MGRQYPRFRVAICHAAPVFLNARKTVDKACSLIAEAANHGAALVVFSESYVPGFPVWSALYAPIGNHDFFKAMAGEALRLDGPEMKTVRQAAHRHSLFVSLGFTEGTEASIGCIWNSNVLIGLKGEILNLHRKLVPTFYEKLIWANGDARGLRVTDTDIGRLGMLICGENTNPLARFVLMAEGEQVHISSYPAIWPTRPHGDNKAYDLRRAIEIRAAAHAFEAKAFNIVASGFLDAATRASVGRNESRILDIIDNAPRAASFVIGPQGERCSELLADNEGIIYAEIDVAECVEPKQFHDVVGYYNRFDIFRLYVDRSPREPIRFRLPGGSIAKEVLPDGDTLTPGDFDTLFDPPQIGAHKWVQLEEG